MWLFQVDLTFQAELQDDMGDDLVCMQVNVKLVMEEQMYTQHKTNDQHKTDDTLRFKSMS